MLKDLQRGARRDISIASSWRLSRVKKNKKKLHTFRYWPVWNCGSFDGPAIFISEESDKKFLPKPSIQPQLRLVESVFVGDLAVGHLL